MTKAQRRWLETIDAKGEVLGESIPYATRWALIGQGLVQECVRMYFGPRTYRLKLTTHGKHELEKQRAKEKK